MSFTLLPTAIQLT